MASSDYAVYDTERVLGKWSVSALLANQTINSPRSGKTTVGTSTITVLGGINDQTVTNSNFCADGYALEIVAPVDTLGNVPDCMIAFAINGVAIDTLRINGSQWRNMFPAANRLEGGPAMRVTLGYPFQRAMQIMGDKIAGRSSRTIPNIPLEVTGLKIGPSMPFTIAVISKDGWGQNGTAIQPLVVTLLGNEIAVGDVSSYLATYAQVGSFRVLREPFDGLSGMHMVAGAQDASGFIALPGGTGQNGPTTIMRKIVEATNTNAIPTSASKYVMSNLTDVGGTPGNVDEVNDPSETVKSDLGDIASTTAAFVWDEFGVDFDASLYAAGVNPQVYVGMLLDSTLTIPGNSFGRLIDGLTNPLQYGATGYQGSDSGKYFRLSAAKRFANLLSWGVSVVPTLSASGLSSIASSLMYAMKGGRQVTGQLSKF